MLGQDYYEQVTPLKATQPGLRRQLDHLGARSELGPLRFVDDFAGRHRRPGSGRPSWNAPTTASCARAPTASTSSFYVDGHYSTIDTARRTVTNITKTDRDLVCRSRFGLDRRPAALVWRRGMDGRAIARCCCTTSSTSGRSRRTGRRRRRLTDGAAEQIEYRHADLDPQEEPIDLSKPLLPRR